MRIRSCLSPIPLIPFPLRRIGTIRRFSGFGCVVGDVLGIPVPQQTSADKYHADGDNHRHRDPMAMCAAVLRVNFWGIRRRCDCLQLRVRRRGRCLLPRHVPFVGIASGESLSAECAENTIGIVQRPAKRAFPGLRFLRLFIDPPLSRLRYKPVSAAGAEFRSIIVGLPTIGTEHSAPLYYPHLPFARNRKTAWRITTCYLGYIPYIRRRTTEHRETCDQGLPRDRGRP